MELTQQIKGYFLAIETFQSTNPKEYKQAIEESSKCESRIDHDLIVRLTSLRWNFDIYKNTLPRNAQKRDKALFSINTLIHNCFYDLFLHEKWQTKLSQNEEQFVTLINVFKDLELNNKQRLDWVNTELLTNPTPFELEFLNILYYYSYDTKAMLAYFKTRFANINSYDLAINNLNEFLKLHLGITSRKADYDTYDQDRIYSAQYNSWAKNSCNIPPPQNGL
jgi:hypothetical protein